MVTLYHSLKYYGVNLHSLIQNTRTSLPDLSVVRARPKAKSPQMSAYLKFGTRFVDLQRLKAMADGYYLCIQAPTNDPPQREDQDYILHVKFHAAGTGKEHYTVDYEELECSLLSVFMKERLGHDYHQMLIKLTFNITPPQEKNAFCKKVLERGIFFRQGLYLFLGHSETQLKKKSCYLMRASHQEIHQHLAQFGDFLAERDVRKRARKIGMLFSPLNKPLPLDSTQYKIEPEVQRGFFGSHSFTDVFGFMSPEFSNEVQEYLESAYPPSVVHVRFRGVEGTLVLKEDLTDVKVQFHSSMQKFATPEENTPESLKFIDVVDYSRPYENGYLDRRMIMLLAHDGVPTENLMELQSRYYEMLEGMCRETAELFLLVKGEFGLLRDIRDKGISDQIKKQLKFFRNQELEKMKKADGCTRILVPNSRVVFAISDPYNKLKHGECYFNPTLPDDDAKHFPGADPKFVVIRKPCYHPGDVQVLRLTDDKQGYEKLRDCLVLPTKGPRPYAFELAGGTLDGNKFFVSWSKNLLPKQVEKPCNYPLKEAPGTLKSLTYKASTLTSSSRDNPQQRNEGGRKEMREYFASFTDDLTERIDQAYMEYAAIVGPSSTECRKLSKIFYQAVNLTADRAVLVKELSKLDEKEPNGLATSDDLSLSAVSDENSTISSGEPIRQRARRLFMRQPRSLCNPGNHLREKIEARAKGFVERAQREFRKSFA